METELLDFVYCSFFAITGVMFLSGKGWKYWGFKFATDVKKGIWFGYKTRKRIQQTVWKLL